MSYQLSAVSLNRTPRASYHRGQRKHRSEVCGFLGSPYGAPAHRKVPGARPEGGADRMSAPDLRGRMPRKISAGTRNRGCAGVSRIQTTVRWTVVPANGRTGIVRPGLFAEQDAQRKVAPSGG